MKYEDIKDFIQRCEEHPAHQTGMVSYGMIQERLSEEIDELRAYIEQRTWVGLTDKEKSELWEISRAALPRYATYSSLVEAKLKEKNGYAEEKNA